MKHISAGVDTDIYTKLIKNGILWLENGSNGYLLCKISSEKAKSMWRRSQELYINGRMLTADGDCTAKRAAGKPEVLAHTWFFFIPKPFANKGRAYRAGPVEVELFCICKNIMH